MSPNKENYLKTIFELEHDHQKISNKNIADILNVSAPSVTEMLTALTKEGLVFHTPYNEISLTDAGLARARELVRKHRIWEVFLADKLHYAMADVHQAADILEHATDDRLADRLNEFLGRPKRCPHGGIIPGNSDIEDDSDITLGTLAPEDSATLQRVIDNHDFLKYFEDLQLRLGERLTVVKKEPFSGPFIVQTSDRATVAISENAAGYMFVTDVHYHTKTPDQKTE
ncbi:winged helix-turn-helix transcriptional regulator [Schleiferilactobacillus harbinensis]|jgi:DtxR family Mn-dependent transcriptional regulator|uniref:Manganese transport regulator n=2 Tax=Schleiferilactobacillus harbinensis TaxID=304207 RepID=A0A510TXD5_9LACO|nr:metal-dependent transcriptional regulator [Schleiferilactobacillus harbinensis]KRM24739.1 Iron-dependent repressor [Schleiferilactobacillus harbinensis DSM 16991]MBO3091112.1 metal-dependent transcriptional regulator [Schleiferilactobacillus harbinensis]MCI1687240.1 metal-dependent transcriptional regulator [Schleiferilactobacillus harbinensis]MCI1782996.1 metal-dependent transcriptional regulator [Schleiferilactobacillus harbinensis]MCI1851218.1 metal-dependent transcriptional regulator [S